MKTKRTHMTWRRAARAACLGGTGLAVITGVLAARTVRSMDLAFGAAIADLYLEADDVRP